VEGLNQEEQAVIETVRDFVNREVNRWLSNWTTQTPTPRSSSSR